MHCEVKRHWFGISKSYFETQFLSAGYPCLTYQRLRYYFEIRVYFITRKNVRIVKKVQIDASYYFSSAFTNSRVLQILKKQLILRSRIFLKQTAIIAI